MKKIIIMALAALLLSSCGVGSYTVSTGKADESYISFTSVKKIPVTVSVDGKSYNVSTVKTKYQRPERNIRKTAENTIVLTTGKHEVAVVSAGKEIFRKTLFVSPQEHKIIDLK